MVFDDFDLTDDKGIFIFLMIFDDFDLKDDTFYIALDDI